jgi:hypothetical protein
MKAPIQSRVLCAVLASPPVTSGLRTMGALKLAANLLGCDVVRVVNLLPIPTHDLPSMSTAGAELACWKGGRPHLTAGLRAGDAILAGWGVSVLTGPARAHQRAQVRWLVNEAARLGCDDVWTVGRQPRHPSRWHQYVSDRHGRTTAAPTTAERLAEVIVKGPWARLLPPGLAELSGRSLPGDAAKLSS